MNKYPHGLNNKSGVTVKRITIYLSITSSMRFPFVTGKQVFHLLTCRSYLKSCSSQGSMNMADFITNKTKHCIDFVTNNNYFMKKNQKKLPVII